MIHVIHIFIKQQLWIHTVQRANSWENVPVLKDVLTLFQRSPFSSLYQTFKLNWRTLSQAKSEYSAGEPATYIYIVWIKCVETI